MADPTIPSRYLPIWNALKKDGICKISADPTKHKTIIKNVRNARDDDLGFRLQLEESNRAHQITTKRYGAVIIFYLTYKLKPRGI